MNRLVFLLVLLMLSVSSFSQNQVFKGNVILQTGDNLNTPAMEYGSKLYFGWPSDNSDDIWIARYNVERDKTELRVNIGDDYNDRFIVGRKFWNSTTFTNVLVVHPSGETGRVGINILNPNYELDVKGTIRSDQVKIEVTTWSDFVFNTDYKLPSLSEVENHIREHKHLPDIPSGAEVMEKGIDVGDMQAKLLQKIEELTLYVIDLKKENEEQNKHINEQNTKIEYLLKKE